MTTKTITQVVDEPRKWASQSYGDMFTLSVTFEDGDRGDVTTNKAERVGEILAALKDLVGKPSEFELQDGGKWPSGDDKPWKIKDYPGKPGGGWQGGGSSQPSGGGGGRKSSPEDRSSIEAQVAAKIAGEVAVALIGKGELPIGKAVDYVTSATYLIDRAIRSAAQDSGSGGDRPSGGPLPSSGPDEAEGGVPASPSGWRHDTLQPGHDTGPLPAPEATSGPATAKQKAKANMQYGGAGKLMVAAKAMFPEITKVGDITEDQMAALIEDKEQG